jgi:phage baseplate assembly protein W
MKRSKTFLGQGWSFPPVFVRDLNAVVLTADEENIRENLNVLFSTQPGERIMNQKYGVDLKSYIFQNPDGDVITAINEAVRSAILFYEPRIKLINVNTVPDPDDRARLNINVQYTIRTSNSRRNYVFPFYIIEGTQLIK